MKVPQHTTEYRTYLEKNHTVKNLSRATIYYKLKLGNFTVKYSTVQYNIVKCSTVECSVVQYSTVQ